MLLVIGKLLSETQWEVFCTAVPITVQILKWIHRLLAILGNVEKLTELYVTKVRVLWVTADTCLSEGVRIGWS